MMVKTVFGITLRGVAYFGASSHICIGIFLFSMYLDKLENRTQPDYKDVILADEGRMERENFMFIILFLLFGCLIFKAVDKENKAHLQWTCVLFFLLQMVGFIGKILAYRPRDPSLIDVHPTPKDPSANTTNKFKALALEVVTTFSYLIILYLYSLQLRYFEERVFGGSGSSLCSSNSARYFENNRRRGNRPQNHLNYNYEPPPAYSSSNNINLTHSNNSHSSPVDTQPPRATTVAISAVVSELGPQHEEPCTSSSVIQNNGKSLKTKGLRIKKFKTFSDLGNNEPQQCSSTTANALVIHIPVETE